VHGGSRRNGNENSRGDSSKRRKSKTRSSGRTNAHRRDAGSNMRVTVMTETRGAAIINGAATVKAAKATAHKDTRDRLMTSNRAPWWQVLGIPEGSTLDKVKVAYYTKVKQYHPDKVIGLGEEFQKLADVKTKEINEAFESAKRALR
jgi:preprotein translocase subunit Sec63